MKCSIRNSAGIQIGDHNYMEISGMSSVPLDMNFKEEPAAKYHDIFGKISFKDLLSSSLELSYLFRGILWNPEISLIILPESCPMFSL